MVRMRYSFHDNLNTLSVLRLLFFNNHQGFVAFFASQYEEMSLVIRIKIYTDTDLYTSIRVTISPNYMSHNHCRYYYSSTVNMAITNVMTFTLIIDIGSIEISAPERVLIRIYYSHLC